MCAHMISYMISYDVDIEADADVHGENGSDMITPDKFLLASCCVNSFCMKLCTHSSLVLVHFTQRASSPIPPYTSCLPHSCSMVRQKSRASIQRMCSASTGPQLWGQGHLPWEQEALEHPLTHPRPCSLGREAATRLCSPTHKGEWMSSPSHKR
jgi:hypothetical protein